jgi:hypothetical protein
VQSYLALLGLGASALASYQPPSPVVRMACLNDPYRLVTQGLTVRTFILVFLIWQ